MDPMTIGILVGVAVCIIARWLDGAFDDKG